MTWKVCQVCGDHVQMWVVHPKFTMNDADFPVFCWPCWVSTDQNQEEE